MKNRIAYVLKEEKYIKDFIFISDGEKVTIRIFFKYDHHDKPVIAELKRVSKPGCRIYVVANEIPRVLDGLGVAILSTSKGIISNKAANKFIVGGEVISNIL